MVRVLFSVYISFALVHSAVLRRESDGSSSILPMDSIGITSTVDPPPFQDTIGSEAYGDDSSLGSKGTDWTAEESGTGSYGEESENGEEYQSVDPLLGEASASASASLQGSGE